MTQSDDAQSTRFAFPVWANYLLPVLVIAVLGGGLYMPVVMGLIFSPNTLNVGYRPVQPVPYSHALHVGELGMDCRYCHTTVEDAAFAAIPPTETCMNCHHPDRGVRTDSDKLRLVRDSYASGEPVEWVKVHDLADYAYFDHSAHINKGVGCETCHGRVDQMDERGVRQVENLSMSWCLECHRQPERFLRPVEEVTTMGYQPEGGDQLALGRRLKEQYNIHDEMYMSNCSLCHR